MENAWMVNTQLLLANMEGFGVVCFLLLGGGVGFFGCVFSLTKTEMLFLKKMMLMLSGLFPSFFFFFCFGWLYTADWYLFIHYVWKQLMSTVYCCSNTCCCCCIVFLLIKWNINLAWRREKTLFQRLHHRCFLSTSQESALSITR